MKIHPEHFQGTHRIDGNKHSIIQVPNDALRPQDAFVTMAGSKSVVGRAKDLFMGTWQSIRSFFTTAWEWIYWIIRLCPSENTRMEVIDSIIDDPIAAADEAKKQPVEFVGEMIAATLINPGDVDAKRRENRKSVGKFVRKFLEVVDNREALFQGKNGILQNIRAALGIFNNLTPEQVFVKFLIERPTLVAGAMKSYCKKTLNKIGEKEGKEVNAIKTALECFVKVADQASKDPTGFENFLKGLFGKSSFNFEEIGVLAVKHLDNVESDADEQTAFKICSEESHQALHRLNERPDYLGLSKDANLGISTMYGALLAQLSSSDFTALAGIMKEDYPLGAEVCEHLADIAQYPSQFKRVCNNLHKAWKVLEALENDYKNPPAVED